MPGPVITTLMTPSPAAGNQTADGSEDVLAAASSLSQGGVFVPQIDLSNMQDGDVAEIRIYGQANSSSSLVQQVYLSFANKQSDPLPPLPATAAATAYKLTLKQTAGSNRAYQWSVLNLNGV